MKRIISVLLIICVLALPLTFAACGDTDAAPAEKPESGDAVQSEESAGGGSESTEKYVIRVGATAAQGTGTADYVLQLEAALAEKTDAFEFEFYPSNQFGTNNEMITAVQNGSLQAVALPIGFFGSICPEVNILDCPLIFGDFDTAFAVLNDRIDYITSAFEALGMYDAAWLYTGDLWCDSTEPNATVADLAGQTIRIVSSDINSQTCEALGAVPYILATSDMPMAMQNGTINGGFNGLNIISSLLIDVTKYVSPIPVTPCPDAVIFNTEFLNSLPDELRETLLDTAHDVAVGENYDEQYAMMQDYLKIIEDAGITVTYPSDELTAELEQALRPVNESFPDNFPELADGYYAVKEAVEAYNAGK